MQITSKTFGNLPNGSKADIFTLKNDKDITVKITNYGAIITSVETPDNKGKSANIVCGFDKLEDYLSDEYLNSYPYFGC
ncbi:MAG TPA: hypothetical protein VKA27_15175, partial [Sunxiuqinia sp.]|nr:hypothetical protein [Sunxiuqinia sp.]